MRWPDAPIFLYYPPFDRFVVVTKWFATCELTEIGKCLVESWHQNKNYDEKNRESCDRECGPRRTHGSAYLMYILWTMTPTRTITNNNNNSTSRWSAHILRNVDWWFRRLYQMYICCYLAAWYHFFVVSPLSTHTHTSSESERSTYCLVYHPSMISIIRARRRSIYPQ